MAVERAPGGTSLIDVLDRILDKGIVIDAWVRISLVGIDLITVEGDPDPGIDDDAFVEDSVEYVDETGAARCAFNCHDLPAFPLS